MPLRLLWYAKDVRHPFAGVTRVIVPLAGGPPPPDAEARITLALERSWITPLAGPPYADAVAVSIDAEPRAMDGRAYWLVLVISAAGNCASLPIEHMGRHLRAALAQLGTPDVAAPRPHAAAESPAPTNPAHVRELVESQLSSLHASVPATGREAATAKLRRAEQALRTARAHAAGAIRPSGPT